MLRRVTIGGAVILALASAVVAALIPRHDPTPSDLPPFAYLEVLVVVAAGIVGLARLGRRPEGAAGLFAVGLYALLVGTSFVVVTPLWGGQDNAVWGALFLASVLVMVGIWLSLAGTMILVGRPRRFARTLSVLAGLVMGAIVAIVDTARWLSLGWALPLLIALAALVVVARSRLWPRLARPLLLAGAAAVVATAWLLIRGPDDWGDHSQVLRLYSWPIVLASVAVSLAILDSTRARYAS